MFARWQSDRADARVGACLFVAVIAHVAVIGGALVEAHRPAKIREALSFVDAIVERPAFANPEPAVRSPPPPPAEPVVKALPPAARGASAGDPYEPAAAVAAASKVVTGGDGSIYAIATREGAHGPGFGFVAGDGTSDVPTFEGGARIGGVIGGTGIGLGAKGRGGDGGDDLGPDRSRRSGVLGGYTDACEFPDEANGIDSAVVVVVVAVRADGSAANVVVASDPGHGFGDAAHRCAMRSKYAPALDRKGRKIAGVTPLINVRFTR